MRNASSAGQLALYCNFFIFRIMENTKLSVPPSLWVTLIHWVLYWHDTGTQHSADKDCGKNEIALITEEHIKTVQITTSLFPSFTFTWHTHANKNTLIILITSTGNFFRTGFFFHFVFISSNFKQLVFARLPVVPDSVCFSGFRVRPVSTLLSLFLFTILMSTSDPGLVYTPFNFPLSLPNFLGWHQSS